MEVPVAGTSGFGQQEKLYDSLQWAMRQVSYSHWLNVHTEIKCVSCSQFSFRVQFQYVQYFDL